MHPEAEILNHPEPVGGKNTLNRALPPGRPSVMWPRPGDTTAPESVSLEALTRA